MLSVLVQTVMLAQVYLGGFDNEEQAALAYDIAAIKFRAHEANTNYNISNYEQELLHFDEVSCRMLTQHMLHDTAQSSSRNCKLQSTGRLSGQIWYLL